MAKKIELVPVFEVRRTVIGSPFFCGFLDEMPQDAKDKMRDENPKMYGRIFEKETV
jgi:hypothetical protein